MVTFEHLEKTETISANGDESDTDLHSPLKTKALAFSKQGDQMKEAKNEQVWALYFWIKSMSA